MSKIKIIFVSVFAVLVIAVIFFYFTKDERLALIKSDTDKCIEKSNDFFTKMNTKVNGRLDYSFAENDSALIALLGSGYSHVSKKNNNCYAVVKNYNPTISEYRYSILNVDTEELNPVLLEHDLGPTSSASYREDFLKKYKELFAN